MNRQEAEDYIYASYLRARDNWDYDSPDSLKRSPSLSRNILRSLSGTPTAVITGSKGKGSIAAILSAILGSELKIGRFTSPHISDFRERIWMDGQIISENDFIFHIEKIKPEFDKIQGSLPPDKCISPIAVQTALALSFFNTRSTDFNILECGKGARYDDVSNVLHEYAVINTIFLEHTRELGNTLKEIAEDKSHVITGEQKCVYVGPQTPEVLSVIKDRALKLEVPLKIYGEDFKADNISYSLKGMTFDFVSDKEVIKDIKIPLLGEHQAKNSAVAIALSKDILGHLKREKIEKPLSTLSWPGRMQIISDNPFIMLDACINAASTQNVKETLKYLKTEGVTLIIGIPQDKDYLGVAKEMKNYASQIILTKSRNPHYLFSPRQVEILHDNKIEAIWREDVWEAIEYSRKIGNPTVILGTTSLITDVLKG